MPNWYDAPGIPVYFIYLFSLGSHSILQIDPFIYLTPLSLSPYTKILSPMVVGFNDNYYKSGA